MTNISDFTAEMAELNAAAEAVKTKLGPAFAAVEAMREKLAPPAPKLFLGVERPTSQRRTGVRPEVTRKIGF